jgi:hypothetical protein
LAVQQVVDYLMLEQVVLLVEAVQVEVFVLAL